jgi:hypothetical protein
MTIQLYRIHHPDGWWYVGQTRHTVRRRFSEHKRTARHGEGSALHRKMRELGLETFQVTAIGRFPTRGKASEAEVAHIREGRGKALDFCLNRTDGGSVIGTPWSARAKKIGLFDLSPKGMREYGRQRGWNR